MGGGGGENYFTLSIFHFLLETGMKRVRKPSTAPTLTEQLLCGVGGGGQGGLNNPPPAPCTPPGSRPLP